ncbi:UNVERIFIED_CONTAM: Glutathione synthetase, chloroplastic [Sesamum angustifolium]|uniref:glutathione synthase n=1 Tax=Sesamum angustifolium TaxID=2727405 RepID=A0AAW2PRY8_9LAMI
MLTQFRVFGVKEKICILKGCQERRRDRPEFQHHRNPCTVSMAGNAPSSVAALKCSAGVKEELETQKSIFDPHGVDPNLVGKMEYDALVWSSLHGLVVGDRASQMSGRLPGVGLVHAPISLLPMSFPESHWKQACEVAPIFNELVDRVSLDAKFLQEALSRFLENKDDIAKVRKCFAGLWSLDDSRIVKDAIQRPGLYVMKPQREGGGNNIYGDDVSLALQRLEKEGMEEDAAYILMQRIFPTISPAILIREGVSHKEHVISELGVYATYLRIVNDNAN